MKINNILPGCILISALIISLSFTAAFGQDTAVKALASAPKIIASGVVNGKAVLLPKPAYPKAAVAAGVSGSVNVQVTIDEAGNVISAKAVSGPELLKEAATAAALQAKFKPTTLSGEPVKVTGVIVYNFAPLGYEEKLKAVCLGMLPLFSEMMENPEEKNNPDNAKMGSQIAEDFPELTKDLEPLNALQQLTKAERDKTLADVLAKIEPKLTGANAWQFSLGKHLNGLFREILQMAKNPGSRADESAVRMELISLREKLKTPPADFPPAVLAKFKTLADMADNDDLSSEESVRNIFERIMNVLNTISPDQAK
jgi:TonB family protein